MAGGPVPARRTLELIRDESVRALQAAEKAARERFNEARLFASLGVGLALVGFMLVAQMRGYESLSSSPEMRSDRDLALVVQEMNAANNDMRSEALELEMGLARAQGDAEGRSRLVADAARELEQLRVISGAAAVEGPGVAISVSDPDGSVAPEDLVALLGDLRAAGAEALAVEGVRVDARTALTGGAGDLAVDGLAMSEPYRIEAVGDPTDLVQAVELPGGIGSRLEAYPGVSVVTSDREDVRLPAAAARAFAVGKPDHREVAQ